MRSVVILALCFCIVAQSGAEPAGAPLERTAAIYVKAKYDDVWKHLTDAKSYAAWSSAPGIEFGSKTHATVAWGVHGKPIYKGTLKRIEKGEGFSHTFAFQGLGFDETTTVHAVVKEQGPVVLVTYRHDCTGAPRTHEMIGELGWTKSLSRLKTLLETGTAMPWPVDR